MRLEINGEGRIVIREVSDKALSYIDQERRKLVDPIYQHWVFSQNYDGTVYVTVTAEEDKTEIVRMIDGLIEGYGLTFTNAAAHLVCCWRRDLAYTTETERTNRERDAERKQIADLKRVLAEGCKNCVNFLRVQEGDEAEGYCTFGEKRHILERSPLSSKHGEYHGGIRYWGHKYYPCDQCKYMR